VDPTTPYAQVVEESKSGVTSRFDFGLDVARVDRGSGVYYYFYDALGSTRALSSGANGSSLVDALTYGFDAFGRPSGGVPGSTTGQSFALNGQQFDSETGLYYLRARYYDPETGRFVSQDPFEGVTQNPSSIHRYRYAANDPVDQADPGGEYEGIIGFFAASSMAERLRLDKTASDWKAYRFAKDAIQYGLQDAVQGQIIGFLQSLTTVSPLSPFSDFLSKQPDAVIHDFAQWLTAELPKENAEEFFLKLRGLTKKPGFGDDFAGNTTFGHLYLEDEGIVLVDHNVYPSNFDKYKTDLFEDIITMAIDHTAWETKRGMGIHVEGVLAGKCKAYGLHSRRAILTIDKPMCKEWCHGYGSERVVTSKGCLLPNLKTCARKRTRKQAGV